jgi:hypothetical protein
MVIALPEELEAWVQRQMPRAMGNADRARLRAEVRARRSRLVELRTQLSPPFVKSPFRRDKNPHV